MIGIAARMCSRPAVLRPAAALPAVTRRWTSTATTTEPQAVKVLSCCCRAQVGQDCKHLGALVVPDPDALVEAAAEQGAPSYRPM